MKHRIEQWKVIDIFKKRGAIEFPDYQREPNVWDSSQKSKLIDSIISDIPIPLIFLYEKNDGFFDCIDGRQRINSIVEFFNGDVIVDDKCIEDFNETTKERIENFKIPIAIIEEGAEDQELREMFRRLQLGKPLNVGEKLHSLSGDMKDFVFKTAINYPFIKKVRIPKKRFSKEQIIAQICINSFGISILGKYQSANYDNLLSFFKQYQSLKNNKENIELIEKTFDVLNKSFGKSANEIGNRAYIITAYLFVENLIRTKKENETAKFAAFYLRFIRTLKEQVKKGLDYDKKYRKLLYFYNFVIQAAYGQFSIKMRNEIITEFFEYYNNYGKIKEDTAIAT
ncbi:MAG: DUF262 domain-containing protein [Candidatus Aenigmatarchaeota archaeon]